MLCSICNRKAKYNNRGKLFCKIHYPLWQSVRDKAIDAAYWKLVKALRRDK
jgi:hypothetical protein